MLSVLDTGHFACILLLAVLHLLHCTVCKPLSIPSISGPPLNWYYLGGSSFSAQQWPRHDTSMIGSGAAVLLKPKSSGKSVFCSMTVLNYDSYLINNVNWWSAELSKMKNWKTRLVIPIHLQLWVMSGANSPQRSISPRDMFHMSLFNFSWHRFKQLCIWL